MLLRYVLGALVALALAACGSNAPPQQPMAALQVSVVPAQRKSVQRVVELPARVQAIRTADVRARVDGIVERRLYEEGTDVRAGDRLFLIDPRPLRAALQAAEAQLKRAETEAGNARRDVERYRPLVAENAISKQEFDAAEARLASAESDVDSAAAEVTQARLNLDYALVTAPIAGRAGRAEVTEGALVKASEGTLMTTVEQLHPIYVNLSQSNTELLAFRREVEARRVSLPDIRSIRVTLLLEDGAPYEQEGRLDFLDLAVDPGTGAVGLRATFPNPNRILLPGMFVRARLEAGEMQAVTIPQRAVVLSAGEGTVMTVGADNKVVPKTVRLGELVGDEWVVQEGLEPGTRVIVDNLQKLQPGMPVQPVALGSAPQVSTGGGRGATPAGEAPAPAEK
jgi:membrane fusion protein (multidrug efflux system)